MVNRCTNNIQFALFPPRCLLCGGRGDGPRDLCHACADALPCIGNACPVCALPLPSSAGGAACGRCRGRPPFAATRAAYLYAPPLDRLVQELKFAGRLGHARLLGELLVAHLEAVGTPPPEMVIPVPLHPRRLRMRGYNQARELARPVARWLDAPLCAHAARRLRDTAAQSGLDAAARRRNVRGAFEVDAGVAGRRVALVDDVVTTGNTVTELARELVAAGAERVEVWCLARAPGP